MILPFSLIGYIAEPFYLWLLRNSKVITVSESTKKDLIKYGFKDHNIEIISEGIEMKPIKTLSAAKKFDKPTLLSLGSLRPMKRTLDQVKAFEMAKKSIPELQLKIAGGGSDTKYGKKVLQAIEASKYRKDITYFGRVTDEQRKDLMRKCHFIIVTSIKEGWGLIVTEAASQGTPAIAYNVDGLRDSIKNNSTGLLSKATPKDLGNKIVAVMSLNKKRYSDLQKNAHSFAKKITFTQATKDFLKNIRTIK